MKRSRPVIWYCLLLLLAVACEEKPSAALLSVTVDEKSIVLPSKGSVRLPFAVEEADYGFDLSKDVFLYPATGSNPHTTECRLSSVERDTLAGHYIAVIQDAGLRRDYRFDVLLGVRAKDGTIVFSAPFECCGDRADTRGVVPETGLPILYINTENDAPIRSKTDYVNGTVRLLESVEGVLSEALSGQIRGRGNTTWGWPKKPYLLKLDKKASLLGMPAHKRWVLLANFMDRTLMRNLVAMKVASLTSLDWTPRCQSVELVLNGVHQGTYLLIEQVRVDKNRVDLKDDGFLLELDFHFDNEVQWMDPHGSCAEMQGGIPFGVKHPDSDEISTQQLTYVKDYVSRAAEALYGPEFRDPEKGYAAFIDVDSFIDYWIVFEVMGNHELGNPGSVFFHMEHDGPLKAGPCWDFDWGVLSYLYNPGARTGLLNLHAIWYDRLFQDPDFRARVRTRFLELLPALQTIPAYMDAVAAELQPSATLNFRMWNPAQDGMINGDENLDFQAAVNRLKTIYTEHLTIIQNQL